MSAWVERGREHVISIKNIQYLHNADLEMWNVTVTYWDLGENIQEEGEHRKVEANTLSTKPHLQVLRHSDNLNISMRFLLAVFKVAQTVNEDSSKVQSGCEYIFG